MALRCLLQVAVASGLFVAPLASAWADDTKWLSTDVFNDYINCNADGAPKNPNLKIAFAQTDLNTPWRVTELKSFQVWAKKLCTPSFIWNEVYLNIGFDGRILRTWAERAGGSLASLKH